MRGRVRDLSLSFLLMGESDTCADGGTCIYTERALPACDSGCAALRMSEGAEEARLVVAELRSTCERRVGELGDGTPVFCILTSGHDGDCAPLPEGL